MLPGRPFGNQDFVSEMPEGFGPYWTRGGPKKKQALPRPAQQRTDRFTLFQNMLHQARIAQFRLSPFFTAATPSLLSQSCCTGPAASNALQLRAAPVGGRIALTSGLSRS
jgi:hypothetical protein